jgi:hypothetical protein
MLVCLYEHGQEPCRAYVGRHHRPVAHAIVPKESKSRVEADARPIDTEIRFARSVLRPMPSRQRLQLGYYAYPASQSLLYCRL